MNGAIFFNCLANMVYQNSWPLDDGRKIVAPFWADVDTSGGAGEVYFSRTSTEVLLLDKANTQIRNAQLPMGSETVEFTATDLVIVTWKNVGYYGSSSNKVHYEL